MKNPLCFWLILIPHFLLGQSMTREVEDEIYRRVQLEINPSISIGVLLRDGTTEFYNYGQYNDPHKSPDSSTLYEIGSVTKTFTAELARMHMEDSLGTSVSAYFPDIDNLNLKGVSLSNIRNHIAGFPRLSDQFSPKNWSDPFNGYSYDILEEEIEKLSIDTSKAWRYSNFGYAVLGRAIEISTDESFEDLMGDLLDELGMESTFLELPTGPGFEMAQPYNVGTSNSHWNFTGPSRYAGGLISNTKDLLSYLKYLKKVNPLFISDVVVDPIQTKVPNLGKDKLFYKDGWFVLQPDSSTNTQILLHNGGTGGFISFVGYNKETEVGVVVLANSVNVVDDLGIKLIYPAFELNHPQRTIAYELADAIDAGKSKALVDTYDSLRNEDYPDNIIDVYWLERFHFGKGNYSISEQLSDIMVQELPGDWEVHDIKGQNLEQLKEYKMAKKAYEKALELNPDNESLKEKIRRCSKMY